LLVQEEKPEGRGEWNFTGGHRKRGETPTQAAIREPREEVGYQVEILKQLLEPARLDEYRTLNVFLGRIIGGELRLQAGEIRDARWFSPGEIVAMRDNLRDPERMLDAIAAAEGS
jgi:ADP-ribose pyrophosphatase YjhB (NUDIX family)